jgi:hypothetical protein
MLDQIDEERPPSRGFENRLAGVESDLRDRWRSLLRSPRDPKPARHLREDGICDREVVKRISCQLGGRFCAVFWLCSGHLRRELIKEYSEGRRDLRMGLMVSDAGAVQ